MIRLFVFVLLIVALIALSQGSAVPVNGGPKAAEATRTTQPPAGLAKNDVPIAFPAREVRGFGLTVNDAQKEAVRKLVEELTIELMRQDPPIETWKPTAEFARSKLIGLPGRPGPDIQVPQLGTAKTWIYDVQMPDMSYFVELDKRERRVGESFQRQKVAGLALGGMSIVIALGLGYLRVTRGRAA